MRSIIINAGCILSGILLISMPVLSQVKTNPSTTSSVKMKTDQNLQNNKTAVYKLYTEILNTGKFELLNHVISDDYDGVQGEKGPTGFAQAVAPVRAAFPDIKWTIDDIIAEGDEVMTRWSWIGTYTNAFNGVPPTHQTITHHAITIFKFSNGKISKGWMESDRLGFFLQTGVIPAGLIPAPPVKK